MRPKIALFFQFVKKLDRPQKQKKASLEISRLFLSQFDILLPINNQYDTLL